MFGKKRFIFNSGGRVRASLVIRNLRYKTNKSQSVKMLNECLKKYTFCVETGISLKNETRISKVDSIETMQRCYKKSPTKLLSPGGWPYE